MKHRLHVLAVLLLASLVAIFLVVRADGRRKAGGPVQSDGGSTSSRPDGAAAVRVLIYDASDRRPIEGADIVFTRGSETVQARTDGTGGAVLRITGMGRLQVVAEGYVGIQQVFDARPGDHGIPVWRAGTCEFTATDPQGKPIEGVEIALFPPPTLMRTVRSDPARTNVTGPDGRATWPFLHPAAGYTWKVISDHADALRKPDDHPHIRPAQTGGLIVEESKDPGLAFRGQFSVGPGEHVKVALHIAVPTSVRGIVIGPSGNPAEGAVVKLFQRTVIGAFTSFELEKHAATDSEGRFEFRAVLPGMRKRVQAQWFADGKCFLGRIGFDLDRGESKDLGRMSPNGPHSVRVEIRFDPESAVTPDIRAALAQYQGLLTISNAIGGTSDERDRIQDTLPIPLGEDIVLVGLHDGTLNVQLQTGLRHAPLKARFVDPASVRVDLPGATSVRQAIRVTTADAPVRVRASTPAEAKSASFRFAAVPKGGGAVVELGRCRPKDGRIEASADLTAGDYEVWLVPDAPNSLKGVTNLCGRAQASLVSGRQNEVELTLVPGAILRGRLLDAQGNPLLNAVVFGRATVDGLEAKGTVYAAATDAAGEFLIPGVIPGAVLWSQSERPSNGADSVRVGGAGSETWVDLVRVKPD